MLLFCEKWKIKSDFIKIKKFRFIKDFPLSSEQQSVVQPKEGKESLASQWRRGVTPLRLKPLFVYATDGRREVTEDDWRLIEATSVFWGLASVGTGCMGQKSGP